MYFGAIKKWSERGLGFIKPDMSGPEIFFHARGVLKQTQGWEKEWRTGMDGIIRRTSSLRREYGMRRSMIKSGGEAGGLRRPARLLPLQAPKLRAVRPHGVHPRLLKSRSVRVFHHLLREKW